MVVIAEAFTPPRLPPVSRRAFRFHMAYTLLDAMFAGITGNAPLMAVKAMHASDAMLQLPIAMASIGLFASAFAGVAMSTRRKKPFVVIPGLAMAVATLLMAWMRSAGWFLAAAGVISILDFAVKPAVPSIQRTIYPGHCRSHVAGTLRQYASLVFVGSTLFFSWLLAISGSHVREMICLELTMAGLASLVAFYCFSQLPNEGDGSAEEAHPRAGGRPRWVGTEILETFRNRRFCRYVAIFFVFVCGNASYMGVVPAFFSRELGFGYVRSTLFIHIVPATVAFLAGGRISAWFDRTTVWRSYSLVTLFWGLDPVLLALAPFAWPIVLLARICRGCATVGSLVLAYYTGIHTFARPGRDTSCYMGALLMVNGVARLIAPAITAVMTGHLSDRTILFYGGTCVMLASLLFLRSDARLSEEWLESPAA
jgi:MFS family permease